MKNPIEPNEYQDPRLQNLLELLEHVPPRNPADEMGSRKRFLTELDTLFDSAPEQPVSRLPGWLQVFFPAQKRQLISPRRFAFSAILALIVIITLLFGGAGATVLAAQSSLPGDVLYPVKTSLESTRLRLAADAYDQAQLHLSFAQRRLDEIAGLMRAGRAAEISAAAAEFQHQIHRALENLSVLAASDPQRASDLARQITHALSQYAQTLTGLTAQAPETALPALQQALQLTSGQPNATEIEFTGVVESMADSQWVIAGRAILILSSTEIESNIRVGDEVKVHAFSDINGALTAREIELLSSPDVDEDRNASDDDAANENLDINDNEDEDDASDNSSSSNSSNGDDSNDDDSNTNDDNDNDDSGDDDENSGNSNDDDDDD